MDVTSLLTFAARTQTGSTTLTVIGWIALAIAFACAS
jgi:preprotein translocase subunit SecE